jgi:hypothetical protein
MLDRSVVPWGNAYPFMFPRSDFDIMVTSNGAFGGIHQKLLDALAQPVDA